MFQNLNASLLEGSLPPMHSSAKPTQPISTQPQPTKSVPKKDDKAAWFKLFAELDPLANPDSLLGSNNNQSHAA